MNGLSSRERVMSVRGVSRDFPRRSSHLRRVRIPSATLDEMIDLEPRIARPAARRNQCEETTNQANDTKTEEGTGELSTKLAPRKRSHGRTRMLTRCRLACNPTWCLI